MQKNYKLIRIGNMTNNGVPIENWNMVAWEHVKSGNIRYQPVDQKHMGPEFVVGSMWSGKQVTYCWKELV